MEGEIKIKNQKIKYMVDGKSVKIFVYGTSRFLGDFQNAVADILCSLNYRENHSGFHWGAFKAAWMILDNEEVSAILLGMEEVIFAGHSMGGAVAECMAFIHEMRNPFVVKKLITYGAYPVTNRKEMPYDIIRHRTVYDIVPALFMNKYIPTGKIVNDGDQGGRWPFRWLYNHTHYGFSAVWG